MVNPRLFGATGAIALIVLHRSGFGSRVRSHDRGARRLNGQRSGSSVHLGVTDAGPLYLVNQFLRCRDHAAGAMYQGSRHVARRCLCCCATGATGVGTDHPLYRRRSRILSRSPREPSPRGTWPRGTWPRGTSPRGTSPWRTSQRRASRQAASPGRPLTPRRRAFPFGAGADRILVPLRCASWVLPIYHGLPDTVAFRAVRAAQMKDQEQCDR
jgi:hypothetical protein